MALVNQTVFGPDGRMRKKRSTAFGTGAGTRARRRLAANGLVVGSSSHSSPGSSPSPILTSANASPVFRPSDAQFLNTQTDEITAQTLRDAQRSDGSDRETRANELATTPAAAFASSSNIDEITARAHQMSIAHADDSSASTCPAVALTHPHPSPISASSVTAPAAAALDAPPKCNSGCDQPSGSFACSSAHALSIDDLFLIASSTTRAEYFHGIIRLMDDFGRISESLVKLPQPSRNKKLRAYMRHMSLQAAGLYFPTYHADQQHYRILRFIADESFVLNSRDKAPFLFHFEVQYTGSNVYDSDLYLGLKSKEQIIHDALLLHRCDGCRAINQSKISHFDQSAAASSALTYDELSRPLHPAPNPNPHAAIQAAQSQAALSYTHSSAEEHTSSVEPLSARSQTESRTRQSSPDDSPQQSPRTYTGTHSPSSSYTSPLIRPIAHATSVPKDLTLLRDHGGSSLPFPPPNLDVHRSATAEPLKRGSISISSSPIAASSVPMPVPRPIALVNAFESLSLQAFGESFTARKLRLQQASRFHATLPNTDIMSLIFKHGDDARQEVMAMQFIRLFHRVFAEASLPLYLHPYCVLLTSGNSALIETVKDSISIDSLKKNVSSTPNCSSLAGFFHYYFGMQGPDVHERAIKNFVESMAAYSVACLAFDTLIAKPNGEAMRVQEVTTGTRLVGSRGETVQVVGVEWGISPTMYRVAYQHGSHDVTPNHLVTLRWTDRPRVTRHDQPGTDFTHITIRWTDRVTFQPQSHTWACDRDAMMDSSIELVSVDACTCADCDLSLLPTSFAPYASDFALWWLSESDAAGRTASFRWGDLFDVRADQLEKLTQGEQTFREAIEVPIVQQEDRHERTEKQIDQLDSFGRQLADSDTPAPLPTVVSSFAAELASFMSARHPSSYTGDSTSVLDDAHLTRCNQSSHMLTVACDGEIGTTPRAPCDRTYVEYVYMCVDEESVKQCDISQFAAAWRHWNIDVSGGDIMLTHIAPGADKSACASAMSGMLSLRPKSIIAFGARAQHRWLELCNSLACVDSVLVRWLDGRMNDRAMRIRMLDQSVIDVHFADHPHQRHRFETILESIADAHRIPYAENDLRGANSSSVPFVSITPAAGQRFAAIQVDSKDQRFVLADRCLTHNCYLLQVKDRHNGNLMMLMSGHVVHIDFGFILSNSPGGNVNFESAPFKLTTEFIEIMGGEDSEHFDYFKLLVIRGYLECRKHADSCLLLLEVLSKQSRMACWAAGIDATLAALKERFKLDATEEECVEHAYAIVEQSINNWRTVQYDKYQKITNGIM